MSNEQIRDALVAAGYRFVQLEPRIPDAKTGWRPDVVAWAADAAGTLVPWAVVETKKSLGAIHPEIGLSALARARDLLGTVDHYVVVNDNEWYQADPGIQRLVKVDGPPRPRTAAKATSKMSITPRRSLARASGNPPHACANAAHRRSTTSSALRLRISEASEPGDELLSAH